MRETCALEVCEELIGDNFWVARGLKYHSIEHLGLALATQTKKRQSKKEKHSATWRVRHNRMVKENKGVSMSETEAPSPQPIVHQQYDTDKLEEPWSKVKYNKETYLADEVIILTRISPEGPLTMMMSNLRNVRMYLDDVGGILLRPVRPSKEKPLPLPGQTPTKGKRKATDTSVEVRERKSRSLPVTLTGSHGLNPAKQDTKRWFLVEAMLEGGTTKEIFKKAASTWAKKTKNDKDKYGMVSTPSNARLMFNWLVDKVAATGRNIAFKEKDGEFKVYDA